MDLSCKSIGFVSAFAAPYGGNFIKMLQALAMRLRSQYHCRVCFAFPAQTKKDWLEELYDKYEVGFIKSDNIVVGLTELFKQWGTDLVHTHFEAYDVAVAKAVMRSSRPIKQVWHVHDYMSLDKTGLSLPSIRRFFTNRRFWNQYGKWGKSAYYIAVSDEMAHFVNHYRSHRYKYPVKFNYNTFKADSLIRTTTVINGIDRSRINHVVKSEDDQMPFTFLSFGGESISKGIPTILDACAMLSQKGIPFKLYLTEGYTTSKMLAERYGNVIPDWLTIINQTDNISEIFSKSDCYISASQRETMSMAIAEASIFGLPVIQSDIPGTSWNASNPSAFLFSVDDATSLCETMKRVIDLSATGEMRELTDKTGILNREKLSMDKWVDKIIKIYESLQ